MECCTKERVKGMECCKSFIDVIKGGSKKGCDAIIANIVGRPHDR